MSSCLFECLKEAGLERYYSTLQRRGYDTAFSLLYLPPAELQDVGIATDSDRQRFLQLVQIIASFHQGGELSPRRASSPHRSSVKIKPISGGKKAQSRAQMTNSRRPDSHSSDSSHSSSVSEESPPGYVLSSRRKPRTNFGQTAISKRKITPMSVLPIKHMHNAEERVRASSNQRDEQTTNAFGVYRDLSQGDDFTSAAQPIGVPPPIIAIPMTPSFPASEDSDDVTYATRNIRMSAESLKVQKVMRTKGYNYGLPRDGHQQNGVNGPTPRIQRRIVTRNSNPGSESTKASGSQNSRDSPNSPQAWRRRITVCVRKRPILKTECQVGGFDVVTCNREDSGKDGGLVVHELKHTVDMAEFIQQNVFQFDKVFIELSTNHDIYESAVKPMVDWIMTQTNRATCFGYGQTGAGKTHTLLGNDTEWGVFFHAAKDILSRLGTQHGGSTNRGKRGFSLSISLYEIYCSRIFDLLNDHKRLQALEDSKKQIHIYGLKSVQVQDMEALQEVVRQGLGARSVGVTGANQDSSRSHAIVQLSVKDANGAEFSRLSFIDLAGSERACDALRDSDKQNRLEGAEINQSLLALKECIRSLDLALAHTPFRQSKLTQVLRDSFIGNSKTCMIANISPSHTSLEHTMNTLRYASRVKELHRKPGYSTPRHQRNRSAIVSSRSAQRRPFTADPTYSQSRPGVSASPKIERHISRSVSIDSSTRVMDYTTAFTGQGRELARTPPPSSTSSIVEEAAPEQSTDVLQERPITPENSESTPMRSRGSSASGAKSRSLPVRKTRSIFTPEAIGASSTPSKKTDSVEVNLKPLKVLKEMSANETQTTTSTPASTPRFLNDTELVGGLSINPAAESTKKKEGKAPTLANTSNEATTSASNDNLSSGKERTTETFSNSSSVAVEHGSLKGENTSSSRTSKSANTNSMSGTSMRSGSNDPIISAEETQPPNVNETRTDSNRSRRSSKASVTSNDSDNLGSIEDTPHGAGLPESTNNPGLPSPKKFLTYLKDKHSIRTKALKQQLRKAGRRAKQDSQGSEEEPLSSDFSASSSSANAVSYSTSHDNLTSNVQQHHQQLSLQSGSLPHPVTITNAPTPPRLPSPKLDRSEPRRSSRVSSRSSSPAGRTTPDERRLSTSSIPNPSTMTGLTSASELHARLAAAAALNSHSDSDDAKMSGSEIQLPSTSWKQTIAKASRSSSSSDKENKDASSKKVAYIQRAQSEVIIAHQEHISEILRISIEEERLYHELRDQWSKGKPFDAYTKSLQKLLARKTQSIEALKLQLALYDRVCNAPG